MNFLTISLASCCVILVMTVYSVGLDSSVVVANTKNWWFLSSVAPVLSALGSGPASILGTTCTLLSSLSPSRRGLSLHSSFESKLELQHV